MNASAVLSRILWFVVSIEDNRATMATYYAESVRLRADLADMAIMNRFTRGVVPHTEARMDGDAVAAGRRPAAFDLVAAELAWAFKSDGRKAFADRLRPVSWETTLAAQDADKRARLLALQCEEEALENNFLEFVMDLCVLHGEATTGEVLYLFIGGLLWDPALGPYRRF
jgi:hypothetical protein